MVMVTVVIVLIIVISAFLFVLVVFFVILIVGLTVIMKIVISSSLVNYCKLLRFFLLLLHAWAQWTFVTRWKCVESYYTALENWGL